MRQSKFIEWRKSWIGWAAAGDLARQWARTHRQHFITWCAVRGIELRYMQPEKPDQNAFIERIAR